MYEDGTHVRNIVDGRLGTISTVINGPNALDMDDTITVVEYDDGSEVVAKFWLHVLEKID